MSAAPVRDDLSWRWQTVAGRLVLVTDDSRREIILSGQLDNWGHRWPIVTQDQTGALRQISEDDPVAKIIAAAPDIRRHALALVHGLELDVIRIEITKIKGMPASDHGSIEAVLNGLRNALVASGANVA